MRFGDDGVQSGSIPARQPATTQQVALSFEEQHGRHMVQHMEVVHLPFIWAHRDTCRRGLANVYTKADPQVEC